MVEVNESLAHFVEKAFKILRIPYEIVPQSNYTVDSIVFKKSGNRIYCYVLNKDKINLGNRVNLVFRFRAGNKPSNWFRKRQVNALAQDWQSRLNRVWSNTSPKYREPARVTDQFGLRVTPSDIAEPDFESTLEIYIKIAAEAANVAAKRKNRDWSKYNRLTN